MSKRALKKYLSGLDRESLAEQLMDLYDRFPQVKTYYDFVFNPREEKLIQDARARIRKEYFPRAGRRPKARRSVAHKFIRHFRTLGMDPHLIADLMGFNLETALAFEKTRNCPQAFYRSMLKSFREWVSFLVHNGIYGEFGQRVEDIVTGTVDAAWPNAGDFEALLEQLEH